MYTRDRTIGHPVKTYRHLPRLLNVKICIKMMTTVIKQMSALSCLHCLRRKLHIFSRR